MPAADAAGQSLQTIQNPQCLKHQSLAFADSVIVSRTILNCIVADNAITDSTVMPRAIAGSITIVKQCHCTHRRRRQFADSTVSGSLLAVRRNRGACCRKRRLKTFSSRLVYLSLFAASTITSYRPCRRLALPEQPEHPL